MQTAEQLIATQKAHLEALFTVANKAFEGVEKTVELNLQAGKALLGEAAQHAQAVLSAKDAQELVTLQAGQLQPAAQKAASYNRHLYDITSATYADVSQVVEAQVAELQRNVLATVDSLLKSAPAGSENAVALVKSSVEAATSAFDTVQKAAKQAAEVAEANFKLVAERTASATQQPA